MMMTTEDKNRQTTKRMVIALACMALCFYFGFIIATGLKN